MIGFAQKENQRFHPSQSTEIAMNTMVKYSFSLVGLGMLCFLLLAAPSVKDNPTDQLALGVFGIMGIFTGAIGLLLDMAVTRIEKAIKG